MPCKRSYIVKNNYIIGYLVMGRKLFDYFSDLQKYFIFKSLPNFFFIKIAVPMLIRLHKILVTYFHYSFIPLHFYQSSFPHHSSKSVLIIFLYMVVLSLLAHTIPMIDQTHTYVFMKQAHPICDYVVSLLVVKRNLLF